MLKKVVYAASCSSSFVQAGQALATLAEADVSRERVQRWAKRVGEERIASIEEQTRLYEALPLPSLRTSPTGNAPPVACVEMDGGRIQVRRRKAAIADETSTCWRETLVGCCLSMVSQEHAADPCPSIPQTYVDPQRMERLCREIKGFSASPGAAVELVEEPPDDRPEKPKPLVRSLVATRQGIEAFGAKLAMSAHSRGFGAAPRRAFVADGGASNWSVHRAHFSHYTPVLDFTHAICYVWSAAMAGQAADAGWSDYCQWAQLLWAGETGALLVAVGGRAEALGEPQESDGDTSPRRIVAVALGYLRNQRERMHYADYRRRGLPITSSHVESAIKQINRRMKGSEKFWDTGAEPMLQLTADHLSETADLDRFWGRRPARLSSVRSYACPT